MQDSTKKINRLQQDSTVSIKVLATKPDDLSSISATYMVEGEN